MRVLFQKYRFLQFTWKKKRPSKPVTLTLSILKARAVLQLCIWGGNTMGKTMICVWYTIFSVIYDNGKISSVWEYGAKPGGDGFKSEAFWTKPGIFWYLRFIWVVLNLWIFHITSGSYNWIMAPPPKDNGKNRKFSVGELLCNMWHLPLWRKETLTIPCFL